MGITIPPQQTEMEQPTYIEDAMKEKTTRLRIALFGFFLFIVFVVGLFWLATTPEQTVGLTLSFVAGLSMIFLPCTLPLAFVIVPLTMGKDPKKGLLMALFFTFGLTITLSLYGVFIAALGKTFGLKSDAEVYAVLLGGIAAFLFGLSEIGLVNAKLPSYSGKFPDFIQQQKDYVKTFLLGLFLGNVGVGCPNPAFYILLGYIATVGDLFNGWFLGFIHGLGRSVPLIFLAILGTLGVNALSGLAKHKDAVARAMGWALIFIGAYLLTFGIFGHDWFIASGLHGTWERAISGIGGERFSEVVLRHEHKLIDIPNFIKYGNIFFLGLVAVTILVAFIMQRFSRRTFAWLAIVYMGIALLVGYSTAWTFQTDTNIHIQFHGADAESRGSVDATHDDSEAVPHEHPQLHNASNLGNLPLRAPFNRIDRLPFAARDGVKEFRLSADEFRWEYAKGKWTHAWGYNNQIPGPEIRVNEGDRVRVIVKNNLPDATTVHWHGIEVAWRADGVPGVTQDAIAPGAEFAYEFTATPAGTHLYHSHGKDHMTSAQQMDMGLSGAFIIEPKTAFVSYDREYTLMLDEWLIGEGGENMALAHTHGSEMTDSPPLRFNAFTINGRLFPDTEPLLVKTGERTLVRMINNGTAEFHPMHLHGHTFDIVARDGSPISPALRERRNTETIHPGETVDILIRANNPGIWAFHCHQVHHAASGMIVVLQYEDFDPKAASGGLRALWVAAARGAGVSLVPSVFAHGNAPPEEDTHDADVNLPKLPRPVQISDSKSAVSANQKWWAFLGISLIATAGLSWGVRKYLIINE